MAKWKVRYAKRYAPSIIIWNLEIVYEKDVVQNMYFLSRRMAKRYWEKHVDELKNYDIALGGVQLWLW